MVQTSAAMTTTNQEAKATMTNDDNDDDEDDDKGVQIRISYHLATEYQNVIPSLHVPNDVIAVPADIHRKGLSTIINHLLDRHDDVTVDNDDVEDNDMTDDDGHDKKLPIIPFEFMIGTSNIKQNITSNSTVGHRLLRSTGGIEREVRKLGLSLEEAIHVTYFPAQLPPEPTDTEQEPSLPDWISTMECINTTTTTPTATTKPSNRSVTSILCTGCYDGSIVVVDATARGTSANNGNTNNRNNTQSKSNDSDNAMDVPLSIMATKPLAHDGPIHCMSTTKYKNDVYIATGSMDHSLRIHVLSKGQQQENQQDSLYEFDDNHIIDCSMNGHTAAISSVDTIMVPSSTSIISESDTKMLYVASGDYDGNIAFWEYHRNSCSNEQEEPEQPSSSKKSKTTTTQKGKLDGTMSTTAVMKKISAKTIFRAHTSKVSGITFGNYEKVQASSASTFIPKQLITGSWDHSIKVWDIERQDNISTINGQRVITCFDTSYHTSGVVVSGHPDCTIRLWDTRTTTSSSNKDTTSSITVSDTTLKPSHKEWVSCVKWSPTNPYHIVSTSYDGTMKLWDIRTTLPLYTIRTFPTKEKGLSVCYSTPNRDESTFLFAGGTDCIVKKYKLL